MAITMRRGSDANFDPTKLLNGEMAVLGTAKKVAVAFPDGTVKYMQTEEDAVAYVEQAENSASSATEKATAASSSAGSASQAASTSAYYARNAESAANLAADSASAASESATAAIASATSVNSVFREVIGTFEIDAGTNNHLRIRVSEWDSDSFTPYVVSAKENYVLPSNDSMVYHSGALYLNDEPSAYGERLDFPSTEVNVLKGSLIEISYKTSMGVPYYKITNTNMNNITVPYKECIAKAEEALNSATDAATAYNNAVSAAQGASDSADNAATSAIEAANSATAAIQAGDAKMTDLESRFTTLTTTQQQDAEVIDARKGMPSLRAKLDEIDNICSINKSSIGLQKKNLLKNTSSSQTIDGVTYAVNLNRSVIASGIASAESKFKILNVPLKKGKYFLSIGVLGSLTTYFARVYTQAWGVIVTVTDTEMSFQIDSDGIYNFAFIVANGVSFSTPITFCPMIRYAEITDGTYEQYTDDIQTQVNSIKNDITVNLLNATLNTKTQYGITCTNNGDGTYTIEPGTSTGYIAFELTPSDMLLSAKGLKLLGTITNSASVALDCIYENNTYSRDTGTGMVLSTEKNIKKVCIYIGKGKVITTPLVFKPMLTTNLNATYDDYVPYTGDTGRLNEDVAEIKADVDSKAPINNPVFTGRVAEGLSTTAVGDNSHAEGNNTTAWGVNTHAEGNSTYEANEKLDVATATAEQIITAWTTDKFSLAQGISSHSEGENCLALGICSHAEGYQSVASGNSTHSEGEWATAIGYSSHAEGSDTTAEGDASHAEGIDTTASGDYSHAEGDTTLASGSASHAEGIDTHASGDYSHAEGNTSFAEGLSSHAEGLSTTAVGDNSHAEGNNTTAYGNISHAEGSSTNKASNIVEVATSTNEQIITAWNTSKFSLAKGVSSHVEGNNCLALGIGSHAEGYQSVASGNSTHSEGYNTTASGDYSHAEGDTTLASGSASHSEGENSTASGDRSHAEGLSTTASGASSHSEGEWATAIGYSSHAEGSSTHAEGDYSHAEGIDTHAIGDYSHAEGNTSFAEGLSSHAEGSSTFARGDYSHAEGLTNTALTNQHAQGHYNDITIATANTTIGTSTGTAFVIGNGTSDIRSNAFRVTGDGATYAKSAYNATGADYAEYAEWADGNIDNEDRRGYFVTFDEAQPNMIRKANEGEYILGVVSGNPCIIGNSDESWLGRYMFDDFGAIEYEEKEIEESYTDEETGEVLTRKVTATTYKENPDYDPEMTYVHRKDRKEWSCIGWIGVLSVRDDGTCAAGGYCKVRNGGIATAAERGLDTYRALERISENVIKIAVK